MKAPDLGGGVDPPTTIEVRRGDHRVILFLTVTLADSDVAAIVDQVTNRYVGPRHLSEGRAVVVPTRTPLRYDGIKIKGSGVRGGPIAFDRPHAVPYAVPRYDAEGNHGEDLARGFDRACKGGMSYQQAMNEHRIVAWLDARGFDTLPTLGWGVVDLGGRKSWLCLFNAPFREAWTWVRSPAFDRDLVWEMPVAQARGQRELRRHGVCLGLNGVTSVGGRLVRKDFHAARFVDRNDTFISRTMYELFDVNFCLWNFRDPRAQPGLPEWPRRASLAYLRELTGEGFDESDVDRFRTVNWVLWNHQLSLLERVALLERDPICRHVLELFLPASERQPYRSAASVASLEAVLRARRQSARVARVKALPRRVALRLRHEVGRLTAR